MPLLSIIIPVYNSSCFLERLLVSLRDNLVSCNRSDIEVIFVDDGSSDGSGEFIMKFVGSAGLKDIVTIIAQSNSGVAAARNTGLNRACGEWIMFLDSDDYIEDGFIQTYLRAIGEVTDRTELIYGGYKIIDTQGILGGEFKPKESEDSEKLFIDIPMFPFSKLFRSRVIKDNGLRFSSCFTTGEDAYFLFQFFATGACHVKAIENSGYFYCRHQGSLTLTEREPDFGGKLKMYRLFRLGIQDAVSVNKFSDRVWSHWRGMLGYDLMDILHDLRLERGFGGLVRRARTELTKEEVDDLLYGDCSLKRRIIHACMIISRLFHSEKLTVNKDYLE